MATDAKATDLPNLHDWHRDVFLKRDDVEIVSPARKTKFGYQRGELRTTVNLGKARTVVVQRVLDSMTPAERAQAQAAFDASPAGKAFTSKDDFERREHAALWLAHTLHTTDHETLLDANQPALQTILQVHATGAKVAGHKARLLALLQPAPAAAPSTPTTPTTTGSSSST